MTKRFDSMVRRTLPVCGSTWWILRACHWPTHSVPSAQAMPESLPSPGAGMVASTSPVCGSIFWIWRSAIWYRCLPSKAVPALAVTSRVRSVWPVAGSSAWSASPEANQTLLPS
ncbi:hypothetical protein D3C86_1492360 [compost metagenome]